MNLPNWAGTYSFHFEPLWILGSNLFRVGLAAVLGGCIGLERELKHKPAGLRTNMFICLGAAMFTVLSAELAGEFTGDHTRVAAQIIPGIGFIGAGSILHSRGSVQGITTAATLFVVASVGMAAGGGMYLTAVLSTILILLSLIGLGFVETKFNLKPIPTLYEVYGENADELTNHINELLEDMHHVMESVQVSKSNGHYRMQFVVTSTLGERQRLLSSLQAVSCITRVNTFSAPERE
ncbi:MgtC/SapB family protein [Candidatus Korobacter versatilis]|nr:MgtC/SapB family protein [Candidatus Koribacter versatilis]